MGYRGKQAERARARALRAKGMTMPDIAAALGVSKGSVSLWTRDVPFEPAPRTRARRRGPNALQRRKLAEIEELLEEGRRRVGELSDRERLLVGAALYAGEGSKRDGTIGFANSEPRMVALFVAWLRRFFAIDETRLHARIYLHDGLDIDAATRSWSRVTGIPPERFGTPYRAIADPTMRHNKHEHGCAYVSYCSARTHREVMGLVAALLSSSGPDPG